MDPLELLLAAVAITVMTVLGMAVPLVLYRYGLWRQITVEALTCVTGGIFLGAGMLHMLPEAAHEGKAAERASHDAFPVDAYTAFTFGFMLVYAFEMMASAACAGAAVPKTEVVAVAQRATSSSATASICLVEVPPVTTYDYHGPITNASGLLDHQMSPPLPLHNQLSSQSHDTYVHDHSHPHSHCHDDHSHAGHVHNHTDATSAINHSHSHAPGDPHQPGLGRKRSSGKRTASGSFGPDDRWLDTCEGCEGSHDHVHVGVRHKHVTVGGSMSASGILPFLLSILFSVHSFTEGLALGVQSDFSGSAMAILVAILGHKFVEALSLASSFVKEGVTLRTSVSVLFGYSLMTPLGMLAGWRLVGWLGSTAKLVESLVSAFAAGSFVFLAAHELLEAQGGHSHGLSSSSTSTDESATASLTPGLRAVLALVGLSWMKLIAD